MNIIERRLISIRHNPKIEQCGWLWNSVRPLYNRFVGYWGRNGLERVINGTDRVLVLPAYRAVAESYEPEVWRHLMAQVQQGDTVADVGAYIGLYTVALAKCVGAAGRVIAFEPDPRNFAALNSHVRLNGVEGRVELMQTAVSERDGLVCFAASGASESHISHAQAEGTRTVQAVRLDTVFARRRVHILKIDVEGYEEAVLQGATDLLKSPALKPRLIYIEVHPYAWSSTGTNSTSLLRLLAKYGYRVMNLRGERVRQIEQYGEVVAYRL